MFSRKYTAAWRQDKMGMNGCKIISLVCLLLLISCTTVDRLTAQYHQLLEKEKKIFLGLYGIDSLAATEYINLQSPTERARYYERFWTGKQEEREDFEERVEYAFRQFAKYAPLTDDRMPIYVKYGPPSKREEITPLKKLMGKTKERVRHAEVWAYKSYGRVFDFVRIGRAYKLIGQSEFGARVQIPHLTEVVSDTAVEFISDIPLEFNVAIGRFRQKRNLTRLEIYITLHLEDTTDFSISRSIRLIDKENSLVKEKKSILRAQGAQKGIFFDEINFWLDPDDYYCEIELTDIKNKKVGKKVFSISLIEYQDDAKEISDLIPATLIDDAFTHEKFNKPVGRVIPLTEKILPVYKLFYLYAEVYNLETKNGLHQLKTIYEVYNKEKMRKEIVDVMIKDHMESGDVAYLAAEFHPMDLPEGHYIIVLRVEDLLSGKERTALTEFALNPTE